VLGRPGNLCVPVLGIAAEAQAQDEIDHELARVAAQPVNPSGLPALSE
jgi:hypothetical protein